MFLGKPAFEALASLRSSPTVCATVERAMQAALVLALAAWLVLGAVWVWPLRDRSHHCNPAFVSISFYAIIGLVVVLLALACAVCVLCTCLAVCGLSLRGAVDGVVEMIHGVLTLGEDPLQNTATAASGKGDGSAPPPGRVRSAVGGPSEEPETAALSLTGSEGSGNVAPVERATASEPASAPLGAVADEELGEHDLLIQQAARRRN